MLAEVKKPLSDRYIRFYGPILEVLRELGGAASPREVKARVIEKVTIPENELARTLKSGQNAVENEIAWARDSLRRLGLIDAAVHGVWRLTPEGMNSRPSIQEARALRETIYDSLKLRATGDERGTAKSDQPQLEAEERLDSEGTLLQAIYALSPHGFEKLCKRVLTEAGIYGVEIGPRGADGGIDGRGTLQLNELVSFKVMFQCKRYKDSVGVDTIRNFQAALQGRAEKGIILTTGVFTRDAEKEASREGGMPIELVDGERLVGLMERLQLGVKPRTVYDVDKRFFELFD